MEPRVVVPQVARPILAVLITVLLAFTACDRDSPLTPDEPAEITDPGGRPPRFATSTAPNLKVAFIGDQSLGSDAVAVLQVIKDEGAHMVLHQGDFDYADDPTRWDNQISSVLGPDFPYFASVGNHDDSLFYGAGGYQEKLAQRLARVPDATCTGDLGVNSACEYQGLFFILSGAGTLGSGHEDYIRQQLEADNSIWRICSWHKNQTAMQVGGKGNSVGWGPYEACRELGAIIATAHEHSYSRTKTLVSTELQEVDPGWPDPAILRVAEGATFVFVSGLGGASIRNQDRCLPTTYPYGCNGEWASIYTSDQGARDGALFIEFHVDGDAAKARGYFKDIDGAVVDQFTVTSQLSTGGPVADFTWVEDPLFTVAFADASTDPDGTVEAWSWGFGDGATSMSQNPTHTYSAASIYTVTLTVTDNDGLTSTRTSSVTAGPLPPQPSTVEARVAASSDDAEERASGSMYIDSSDLELVFDGGDQTVGMRFNALTIPPGATIQSAYIQFQADETHSEATSLVIEGEATGSATTFATSDLDISSRSRTANAVSWSPPPWTTRGVPGSDQRTPDIASIVQEIVNGPWSSGNSLVIIITGTGHRTADSFDGAASAAPLLHVEYMLGSSTAPTASFTWTATDLTVDFTDTSSDPDGTVVAWNWDFGDGNTSTQQDPSHTYAAAGDYAVTLTVADNDGETGTATQAVSVSASNQTPTANFTSSCTDLDCSFTDTSTDPDGTVVAWNWDFGDGNTSTQQNPSHTYAAANDYTVTLTVTDNDGATSAATTQTVTVTEPPPPNQAPTANFTSSCTDLDCSFTDTSTDPDGTLVGTRHRQRTSRPVARIWTAASPIPARTPTGRSWGGTGTSATVQLRPSRTRRTPTRRRATTR
jgi:PKD repeat protein